MATSLKNHNFLKLFDYTSAEIQYLIDLAVDLKATKRSGNEKRTLVGKNTALILEKSPTCTRYAFEVTTFDQGAQAIYVGPGSSQVGHRESVKDTACVLRHMYGDIRYHGYDQSIIEESDEFAGVPAWNGLTDESYPTQILADLATTLEHTLGKTLPELSFTYPGDARDNMGSSLMIDTAKMGMDIRLMIPKSFWPDEVPIAQRREITNAIRMRITLTEDVEEGVYDVNFLYADVWVSVGEPKEAWTE